MNDYWRLQGCFVVLWLDDGVQNCEVFAEERTGSLLDHRVFTNADIEEARSRPGEEVARRGRVLRYQQFEARGKPAKVQAEDVQRGHALVAAVDRYFERARLGHNDANQQLDEALERARESFG